MMSKPICTSTCIPYLCTELLWTKVETFKLFCFFCTGMYTQILWFYAKNKLEWFKLFLDWASRSLSYMTDLLIWSGHKRQAHYVHVICASKYNVSIDFKAKVTDCDENNFCTDFVGYITCTLVVIKAGVKWCSLNK